MRLPADAHDRKRSLAEEKKEVVRYLGLVVVSIVKRGFQKDLELGIKSPNRRNFLLATNDDFKKVNPLNSRYLRCSEKSSPVYTFMQEWMDGCIYVFRRLFEI